MSNDVLIAIIAAVATLGAGWLAYKGAVQTRAASKTVAKVDADPTDNDRAIDAWRSMVQTLLVPLQQRIEALDRDLAAERTTSAAHGREIRELNRRLRHALRELDEWRRAARTLARWGTALRDEVVRLGGKIPATPAELLTLQLLEDRDDYRQNPHSSPITPDDDQEATT